MTIYDSLGAQQEPNYEDELIPIGKDYKGDTLYDHEYNDIYHYQKYNFKADDVLDFIYFLKKEDKDFILENFATRTLLDNPVFDKGVIR